MPVVGGLAIHKDQLAELSEIIGRKVDLRTAQDLSRHFTKEVVESAELQYAEG